MNSSGSSSLSRSFERHLRAKNLLGGTVRRMVAPADQPRRHYQAGARDGRLIGLLVGAVTTGGSCEGAVALSHRRI
jgi:hypothetical protein